MKAMDSIIDTIDKNYNADRAKRYLRKIRSEFDKLSKNKVFGRNLKDVYVVTVFLLGEEDNPEVVVCSVGTRTAIIDECVMESVQSYTNGDDYYVFMDSQEMYSRISDAIYEGLNKRYPSKEFWCRFSTDSSVEIDGYCLEYVVLEFDKSGLDNELLFEDKRHPFLSHLRETWADGSVASDFNKIYYNELFRRASIRDLFLYRYEIDFNALSALKYEGVENRGNIVFICDKREKILSGMRKSLEISLQFSEPVIIAENTYKKIRKLLEIAQDDFSLLLDEDGEAFAIGRIKDDSDIRYNKIKFGGFLKWEYFRNGEVYLQFDNMVPRFSETKIGISDKDLLLLKATFEIDDTSSYEKIINNAVKQKHGTMIVFAENAKEEAKRLRESSIPIEPTRVSEKFVNFATKIDGAMMCDEKGVCHSVGIILDGKASDDEDSSRGARYNSAIRYIDQQRRKGKKSFAVVVSEDGYINCFSTEKHKK